jgi:hypothetical protein
MMKRPALTGVRGVQGLVRRRRVPASERASRKSRLRWLLP